MDTREFIAKQIKHFRTEKLGITAAELASRFSPPLSSKTISSWETCRTQPNHTRVLQLCKIFDVSVSDIYPHAYSEKQSPEYPISSDSFYSQTPLYGSIAAGAPLTTIPIEDTFPIPLEQHEKYPQGFFLKVKGESMNNVLPNGSFALIDPTQTEPKTGNAYAFAINDSDTTIKRIKKLSNGYELIPDSKDPTLKSTIYDFSQEDPEKIVIIGRVVWMMLPFDWQI